MKLTPKQIEKFQEIWLAKYGSPISDQEAYDKAIKLVCLMKCIYRRISKPKPESIE